MNGSFGLLIWIVRALAMLLAIGFIAINFLVPLPSFLIAENFSVTVALIIGTILLSNKLVTGASVLTIASLLYLGRISRSVVTPYGTLAPLWETHVPVVLLLTVLGILSLLVLIRYGSCARQGLASSQQHL